MKLAPLLFTRRSDGYVINLGKLYPVLTHSCRTERKEASDAVTSGSNRHHVARYDPLSKARAGIFADDLGRCLVKSSSTKDQLVLITWLYGAIATHPALKVYSNFDAATRAANNKATAGLLVRLLPVDCRKEAVAAVQNEGSGTIRQLFSVLGEVAMSGFMRDPDVNPALGVMSKDIEESKFQAFITEAGNPPQAKPS